MKIVTVVGARPQFIKAAAVSRTVRDRDDVSEVLIHTGQHYDYAMSESFFKELDIPQPNYNLGVGSGMHGEQTGKMLAGIEQILAAEKPDWVLVYGDTNSTLAGALAAIKLHLPLAHVEAGLRSFNRGMPEEMNRVLTDHAADVLFAPTQIAVKNLAHEGLNGTRVVRVGDVMYDAALYYAGVAEERSEILKKLGVKTGEYCLATIHRAENTDDLSRLRDILTALSAVAQQMKVVLPLHPRTRKVLESDTASLAAAEQLQICDPVGYLDMNMLERHARLVMTDSGGVQKEAFFAQVPCITLRDETEWVELVEGGYNIVAGTTPALIQAAVESSLASQPDWSVPLYGTGNAAEVIVDYLAQSKEGRA